jgi:LemA protein
VDIETLAALLGIAVGLPAVFLYQRLKSERGVARAAYAALAAQLARRAQIVPQLIDAARPHAAEHQPAISAVSELLAAAQAARDPETRFGQERALSDRLGTLMAQPALAADARFHELAGQLAQVESDVQYARRYYNGAAKEYDRRLEAFPASLIGRVLGFRPMPAFETVDRREVEVSL